MPLRIEHSFTDQVRDAGTRDIGQTLRIVSVLVVLAVIAVIPPMRNILVEIRTETARSEQPDQLDQTIQDSQASHSRSAFAP
ncbi:hypothetical protein [Calycomorphotria hydatis]|uniref:Uncharacterized protein n=1 Tax=Calycomorphotria hydatis TaxID=2528027 RepID=A0A517TCP9_9PLAN|nr:hypothetical protein [Calycomorphotria hydatis]QDT66150.1 hypothetical protein V22_34150 [Calycomorphotria hydatis]